MKTNKLLKSLISNAYETEGELCQLIEECFKEIFQEDAQYAYSLFEEDLETGREYNGCLQSLDYYKRQINEIKCIREKKKELDAKQQTQG